MNLSTAVKIIKKVFPDIVSTIMVRQVDLLTFELADEEPTLLIQYFQNWYDTYEGYEFWNDLQNLYWTNHSKPSIEQIKYVFDQHGIFYVN